MGFLVFGCQRVQDRNAIALPTSAVIGKRMFAVAFLTPWSKRSGNLEFAWNSNRLQPKQIAECNIPECEMPERESPAGFVLPRGTLLISTNHKKCSSANLFDFRNGNRRKCRSDPRHGKPSTRSKWISFRSLPEPLWEQFPTGWGGTAKSTGTSDSPSQHESPTFH